MLKLQKTSGFITHIGPWPRATGRQLVTFQPEEGSGVDLNVDHRTARAVCKKMWRKIRTERRGGGGIILITPPGHTG